MGTMAVEGLRHCSVLRVYPASGSHVFYLTKPKIISNLHVRLAALGRTVRALHEGSADDTHGKKLQFASLLRLTRLLMA